MKVKSIDHICLAVRNLEDARQRYEGLLGLSLDGLYEAPSESIKVARYYIGDVAFELMEPMHDDCDVARFIRKRGEGVFLISYRVDDVKNGLAELNAKGKKTIDQAPKRLMGNDYAFVMPPGETCGVLIEILEGNFDYSYENPTT